MKRIKLVGLFFGVLAAFAGQGFCQTNLQFTAAVATDEHAIRLTWASTNHELYQIQFANALATNADGTTAWQLLYDDYPSQGTNTFIGDFGNYNLAPQVLHPKYNPMRFYRILDKGQDSLASDEPTVSISSPTNSALVSSELIITVTAGTDQPILSGTRLFVDGQEMQMADSMTNYTVGSTNYEADIYSINTCEWGNGSHILFATAECQSGYGDAVNSSPVATGHGVSAFVPVTFNNLVTRISFSQPSFDPSSGQTQQVSAVFPLNSDWTLRIVDINSNIVQAASGSGMSMLYDWDGTSNGTNLPSGIYYYYITAQTNGASSMSMMSGGGSSFSSSDRASVSSVEDTTELWAVAPDSENVVPFALYPPGFDTNGFTVFSATPSEVGSLRATSSRTTSFSAMDSGGASPSGIGDSGYVTPLPNPQPAPTSPQRPPNNPVRGLAGSFGVAYDTYAGGYTLAPLDNGLHIGVHIPLSNSSAGSSLYYAPLPPYKAEANNFISQMRHWGWNNALLKVDGQLNINDLRGSGSPLNNVNLAVFMSHGVYGTGSGSIDYAANGCKQMYYPVTSGSSAQYLRLSEMNLGGSGTNGLKWAALLSCNSLQHNNWANMQSLGVKPYNSNLHLLLGVDTITYTSSSILWYWAKYINYGTSTNANSASPLTIRNAWYQAAKDAYHNNPSIPSGTVINFAVAGDSACLNDSLQTNSAPQGSWSYASLVQVYP